MDGWQGRGAGLPLEAKRQSLDEVQVAHFLQPTDSQHAEQAAFGERVRVKRAVQKDVDFLFCSAVIAEKQLIVLWKVAIGDVQRKARLDKVGGLGQRLDKG